MVGTCSINEQVSFCYVFLPHLPVSFLRGRTRLDLSVYPGVTQTTAQCTQCTQLIKLSGLVVP